MPAEKKSIKKKWYNTGQGVALIIIVISVFFLIVGLIVDNSGSKKPEATKPLTEKTKNEPKKIDYNEPETNVNSNAQPELESTAEIEYPKSSEETMDRDMTFNCPSGNEVALLDKPTDITRGARLRDKVPCGTIGWAFNQYHNEELNMTFYAINTNDKRVKNTYGWITEDLITWRD